MSAIEALNKDAPSRVDFHRLNLIVQQVLVSRTPRATSISIFMKEKYRVCRKCRYLRYLIPKSKSINNLLNFNIASREPRRLRTQFPKCITRRYIKRSRADHLSTPRYIFSTRRHRRRRLPKRVYSLYLIMLPHCFFPVGKNLLDIKGNI